MKKYDKKLSCRKWFIDKIMPVIAFGLEKYYIELNSDGFGRPDGFGKFEKLNDNEGEEFINGKINDLKESLDGWLKGICEIDYVREKSTLLELFIEVKNPKELSWKAGEVYDEKIEEPYGKERQKIELLKDIEEKYKKLSNKTMFLKIGILYDIDYHLKLFEALKELEKEGLAKTEDNFLKANFTKIEGITITIADKLIKTFNEEKKDKARIITGNTQKSLIDLPKDAKWEDIEIKFKDSFLAIEIYNKKKYIGAFTKENLGFVKTNTGGEIKKPDKQWEFLKYLSTLSVGGMVAEKTQKSIAYDFKTKPNVPEKWKEKLSKKLKEIFGISNDPFYPYKEKNGYQPKFKLKPTAELRREKTWLLSNDISRKAECEKSTEKFNDWQEQYDKEFEEENELD